LHIGWAAGHPFARIIRNPFGRGSPTLTIPKGTINVYSAYQLMLETLAPCREPTGNSVGAQAGRGAAGALRIGLHPFASQECKLWPAENWRQLIAGLMQERAEIWAFGAPSDRQALIRLLGNAAEHVRVVTESVESFATQLGKVDVLVGLDSFAVHLARREGVRSIMINAGNPPEFWSVPDAAVLASSGGCSHYPCFNVPRCKGSAGEYACVKSISVAQVLQSVKAAVKPSP
jgi:heptosyltransferase-3